MRQFPLGNGGTYDIVIWRDADETILRLGRGKSDVLAHGRNFSLKSLNDFSVVEPLEADVITIRVPALRRIQDDGVAKRVVELHGRGTTGSVDHRHGRVVIVLETASGPTHAGSEVVLVGLSPPPDAREPTVECITVGADDKVGCVGVHG